MCIFLVFPFSTICTVYVILEWALLVSPLSSRRTSALRDLRWVSFDVGISFWFSFKRVIIPYMKNLTHSPSSFGHLTNLTPRRLQFLYIQFFYLLCYLPILCTSFATLIAGTSVDLLTDDVLVLFRMLHHTTPSWLQCALLGTCLGWRLVVTWEQLGHKYNSWPLNVEESRTPDDEMLYAVGNSQRFLILYVDLTLWFRGRVLSSYTFQSISALFLLHRMLFIHSRSWRPIFLLDGASFTNEEKTNWLRGG